MLGPRVLPEYRDPDAGRLDLPSAAMSMVAVLAVIYGLKEIAQDGLAWPAGAVRSWPGWPSGWASCAGSGGWPTR